MRSAFRLLTLTPPESSPSDQFWGIYALIGGVRVKSTSRVIIMYACTQKFYQTIMWIYVQQECPSPLRQWCIPPISDPPISEKYFRLRGKFYLFPKNFSIFICQNFWWPFFLVIDNKFWISLKFPCFSTFPPVSEKLLFHPTFANLPPPLI